MPYGPQPKLIFSTGDRIDFLYLQLDQNLILITVNGILFRALLLYCNRGFSFQGAA